LTIRKASGTSVFCQCGCVFTVCIVALIPLAATIFDFVLSSSSPNCATDANVLKLEAKILSNVGSFTELSKI